MACILTKVCVDRLEQQRLEQQERERQERERQERERQAAAGQETPGVLQMIAFNCNTLQPLQDYFIVPSF